MLRWLALVRADVSKERISPNLRSVLRYLVTANVVPSAPIIFTLMIQAESRGKIWGFHGGDYEECRLLGCYAVWLL
jgi:hypothetical protein